MAKGWALSTGNLPRGGLPRNSVDRITDRPDMTSAVDRGRKALTQQKKLLSRFIIKASFYICEINGADQLRDICFHYKSSTILLNFKPLTIFYGCTARFVSDPKTDFLETRGSHSHGGGSNCNNLACQWDPFPVL